MIFKPGDSVVGELIDSPIETDKFEVKYNSTGDAMATTEVFTILAINGNIAIIHIERDDIRSWTISKSKCESEKIDISHLGKRGWYVMVAGLKPAQPKIKNRCKVCRRS